MLSAIRVVILAVSLAAVSGWGAAAWAQDATLRGFVTDQSTTEALSGANVVLQSDEGSPRGAAADAEGAYLIAGLPPAEYVVRVSFVGYEPHVDTLRLGADEARLYNVTLVPVGEELSEIAVEAEALGAAEVTAGHQEISPADIERVPTPDVSGDLAGYLTAQPGIVTTGDRGGQLFIRGGEPSQNRLELDDMPIYQPFHLLGFYSVVPSALVQQADLYAGGYPAHYHGGLSAVIDVLSRNGNKEAYDGALSVSPFTASARMEGPLWSDDVSFLVYGRRSMLEEAAEAYVPQPLPFAFGDLFAKVHADIGSARRLSVTHLQTYDRGRLGPAVQGGEEEQVRWYNRATGGRFILLPEWLPVRVNMHASRSYARMEQGPADSLQRFSEINTTRLGVDAFFPGRESYSINAGLTGDFVKLHSELGGLYQNVHSDDPPFLNQMALYFAPTFRFGDVRVEPGLRMQFYRVRFDPYLEPRLRLIWNYGIHQFSAAAGLYQQEVAGLADRRDAASVFTTWANIPRRGGEIDDVRTGRIGRAVHGILGYRLRLFNGLNMSVEGYYKHLGNLFVSEWTAYPRLTTRLQPADGRSFGAETRVEWRREPFYGYLNYGYSNTVYNARQSQLQLWYGTETMRFRPPHDRRHQLNALASVTLYDFDLSLRWSFGSGLPFSRVLGFDGFTLIDDVEKATEVDGQRRVIYERPYNGVLPTYHRLDVSVGRSFSVGPAEVTVQGTLINAYDRSNIFYLDTFTLRRQNQLPLVPSLGLRVELE